MKITAGKRGDAAREAKDKAENKFYWDAYNYSAGRQRMKDEYQSRKLTDLFLMVMLSRYSKTMLMLK